MSADLMPEDAKIVTLARSAVGRSRVTGSQKPAPGAAEAAAVRDADGRTYVATAVHLDTLRVDALDLAVAMAVSSGATGLEAAAVVTVQNNEPLPDPVAVSIDAVREVAGAEVSVFLVTRAGQVFDVLTT